jgi:hypothetical protein
VNRAADYTQPSQRATAPDGLREWITGVEARSRDDTAACALANELARIRYDYLCDGTPFGQPRMRPHKKLQRTALATAA